MSRIKEARTAAGLTQKQLAELIGCPLHTLTNWEQEIRKPPEWLENLIIDKIKKEAV